MVTSGTPLTEKEKGRRQFLVDKYNKAKSKNMKNIWSKEIVDFEVEMVKVGHNG